MTKTVVCFGETLWDVLPTGKRPGLVSKFMAEQGG